VYEAVSIGENLLMFLSLIYYNCFSTEVSIDNYYYRVLLLVPEDVIIHQKRCESISLYY